MSFTREESFIATMQIERVQEAMIAEVAFLQRTCLLRGIADAIRREVPAKVVFVSTSQEISLPLAPYGKAS
jgi:hypothetical protein